jgi:hypothetical protein
MKKCVLHQIFYKNKSIIYLAVCYEVLSGTKKSTVFIFNLCLLALCIESLLTQTQNTQPFGCSHILVQYLRNHTDFDERQYGNIVILYYLYYS